MQEVARAASAELEAHVAERRRALQEVAERLHRREQEIQEQIEREQTEASQRVAAQLQEVEHRQVEQLRRVVAREAQQHGGPRGAGVRRDDPRGPRGGGAAARPPARHRGRALRPRGGGACSPSASTPSCAAVEGRLSDLVAAPRRALGARLSRGRYSRRSRTQLSADRDRLERKRTSDTADGTDDRHPPVGAREGRLLALHVLVEAGYPSELAERIAHSEADLHHAVELVLAGCSHETAAEILL